MIGPMGVLLAAISLGAPGDGATDTEAPDARRFSVGGGATLLVADSIDPNKPIDLVIHLHGAVDTVEAARKSVGWPCVLVLNRSGLSSVYEGPFTDPGFLPSVLEIVQRTLREKGGLPEPRLGRLTVSAFSAGFGGVRAMLTVPSNYNRIDALILADALYCGYDPEEPDRLDAGKMNGFRRFARDAAQRRKVMLVTHSAQVPEGYASTTETANDLIQSVDARPVTGSLGAFQGCEWTPSRRLERGWFRVLGFDGAEPEDHMKHLRELGRLWRVLGE